MICKLDSSCKSVVLWLNDRRRRPVDQLSAPEGSLEYNITLQTWICDVFEITLTNDHTLIKFDQMKSENATYMQKKYTNSKPLFLKYGKTS